VDPLLGNDDKISDYTIVGNGYASRHEATIALQQKSGVLYTVRTEIS
jgi:hypothetical protein